MRSTERGSFWESLSHDQVGCGDGGEVQRSEQHDSSRCRVGRKASVVKQLIGKLQQKSNVCFFFNLETLFFLISCKLVIICLKLVTVYLMGNSEGKVSKGQSVEMKKVHSKTTA